MARGRSRSSTRAPARNASPARRPANKNNAVAKPAESKAQPPAPAQQGGGIVSGIGDMIMQGMAFGTGSAMAHRAVDAVAGPRGEQAAAPVNQPMMGGQQAAAPVNQPMMGGGQQGGGMCGSEADQFQQCVRENPGDLAKCQFYYDVLGQCQKQGNSMM